MSNHFRNLILAVFVGLFCCSLTCFAQNTAVNDHTRAGTVISKGSNKSYSGKLKVISYRLELIKLDRPLNLNDGQPPLETAFRIVIKTAEQLPMYDLSLFLDENEYQAIVIKSNEVAMILYARTLPNGIKLSLAKTGEVNAWEYSVLSEPLSVPAEYATSSEKLAAEMPVIRLQQRLGNNPMVELSIDISPIRCRMTNIPYVIEIGGKGQNTFCDGDLMAVRFTVPEFNQLLDGAEIVIKRGERVLRRAANLNKRLLEQQKSPCRRLALNDKIRSPCCGEGHALIEAATLLADVFDAENSSNNLQII